MACLLSAKAKELDLDDEISNLTRSRTGVVGRIDDCADPTHPEQALFSVIQVFASKVDGAAASMKRLITSYT